jgi:hypothetical protein
MEVPMVVSRKICEVARACSDRYEIILFGGPNEVDIANDIASRLNGLNVTNLAGKHPFKNYAVLSEGWISSSPMTAVRCVAAAYSVRPLRYSVRHVI